MCVGCLPLAADDGGERGSLPAAVDVSHLYIYHTFAPTAMQILKVSG